MVWSFRFRIQDVGVRVYDVVFRVHGFRFRVGVYYPNNGKSNGKRKIT